MVRPPQLQEVSVSRAESTCDREPIHIPGSIQPFGVLLAVDPKTLRVRHVSENCGVLLGKRPHEVLDAPLRDALGEAAESALTAAWTERANGTCLPVPLGLPGGDAQALLHANDGLLFVELEPGGEHALMHGAFGAAVAQLNAEQLPALFAAAVTELRRLTGFDRVLLYRFDEDEHGVVIAEDAGPGMERYLGLHFPRSDIPEPARRLYLVNPMRVIADVTAPPVKLVGPQQGEGGAPLDLTYSVLRSVAPVHLEYLRNMGLQASMTLSLVIDGRLWGLVTCGHRTPRLLPPQLRARCEVLARVLALQLRSLEARDRENERVRRRGLERRLRRRLARSEGLHALAGSPEELLSLVGAGGAALVAEGRCTLVGRTPTLPEVEQLVERLRARREVISAVRSLRTCHAPAEAYTGVASGMLAIKIPGPVPEHVIWFRPEVMEEVHWGGSPESAAAEDETGRIHPRHSFELWKERVVGSSVPWSAADVEAAEEVRHFAIEAGLAREVEREQRARREAEEAARLRDELVAVVSHDLKSPLQVILMQCALVQRGGEEGLGDRAAPAIARIRRSAERMTTLIRDLLDLARIEAGRFKVEPGLELADRMIEEAVDHFRPLAESMGVALSARAVPGMAVRAEGERIFQVLSNLLSNAVKFTPRGGRIEVSARSDGPTVVFSVQDTGPGIPAEQLPLVFDRFWQAGETSGMGSGLGLFIARGIVEAHGGRIWVESKPGRGCRFSFSLARVATREEAVSSWDGSSSSPHPSPGHS